MDVLHLSPKEIRQIEYEEYPLIIDYCWKVFNYRRNDLLAEMLGGKKEKGTNGSKISIDWTGLNPAHQALVQNKKKKLVMPKKFLESLQ